MNVELFLRRFKKKFSFKEKREFELLEKEIATLETEKRMLGEKMSASDLPYNELQQTAERIGKITELLEEKEMRWLQLSELAG